MITVLTHAIVTHRVVPIPTDTLVEWCRVNTPPVPCALVRVHYTYTLVYICNTNGMGLHENVFTMALPGVNSDSVIQTV